MTEQTMLDKAYHLAIRQHAAQVHPEIELTPEVMNAVRGAIKDA